MKIMVCVEIVSPRAGKSSEISWWRGFFKRSCFAGNGGGGGGLGTGEDENNYSLYMACIFLFQTRPQMLQGDLLLKHVVCLH